MYTLGPYVVDLIPLQYFVHLNLASQSMIYHDYIIIGNKDGTNKLTTRFIFNSLQRVSGWEENEKDMENIDEEADNKTINNSLNSDTTPQIYICATMWHENILEMVQMLKSIFRYETWLRDNNISEVCLL